MKNWSTLNHSYCETIIITLNNYDINKCKSASICSVYQCFCCNAEQKHEQFEVAGNEN
jgi:hypothetical protein